MNLEDSYRVVAIVKKSVYLMETLGISGYTKMEYELSEEVLCLKFFFIKMKE